MAAPDISLGNTFLQRAKRTGNRRALTFEGKSWTYAELWDRANAVARALIACGVGKGTRVGVLMTNRPEFLSAVFGTGLAGGVSVALSTFSTPAWPLAARPQR